MAAEGKLATRWLHDRPFVTAQGIVQVSESGMVHRTYDVEEAFDKLLAKWRVIWRRQDSVPELDQAAGVIFTGLVVHNLPGGVCGPLTFTPRPSDEKEALQVSTGGRATSCLGCRSLSGMPSSP